MKHNYLLLLLSILLFSCSDRERGQKITFEIPILAERNYTLKVKNGASSIELANGTFDDKGCAELIIPEGTKLSVATLSIDYDTPVMLLIVGEKKDFSVIQNADALTFDGSPENQAYLDYYVGQKEPKNTKLLEKYIVIDNYFEEIRFPDVLSSEEKQALITRFSTLDISTLYVSGLWESVIYSVAQLYDEPTDFLHQMEGLMEAQEEQYLYEELLTSTLMLFEKSGQWKMHNELETYMKTKGRPLTENSVADKLLTMYPLKIGDKAPMVNDEQLKSVVLVFHESVCDHCGLLFEALRTGYKDIRKKKYDVVSVSSDVDSVRFEETSGSLPWRRNYCNFEGFDGKDFDHYNVTNTPTIFVIDGDGIIKDKAVMFDLKMLD